jgi:hypothetical protein
VDVILSGVNQKSKISALNLFSHQYVYLTSLNIKQKYSKAIILFIDSRCSDSQLQIANSYGRKNLLMRDPVLAYIPFTSP